MVLPPPLPAHMGSAPEEGVVRFTPGQNQGTRGGEAGGGGEEAKRKKGGHFLCPSKPSDPLPPPLPGPRSEAFRPARALAPSRRPGTRPSRTPGHGSPTGWYTSYPGPCRLPSASCPRAGGEEPGPLGVVCWCVSPGIPLKEVGYRQFGNPKGGGG